MKKTIKILTIIALILLIVATLATPAFASAKEILGGIDNAVNKATVNTDGVMPMIGKVIKAIRNFAIIASVIVLIILGIGYITGSTEKKKDYKETLVPLVVGIVLVVGATSFASFLFSILG